VSLVLVFLHDHLNIIGQSSTDSILNTIKQNSDEEPLADSLVGILPSHSPSTSAKFNNDEYRVPWKLRMRSRKNDNKMAQAKMTQESSPKVVEVHPVRGFQVSFCPS